MEVYDVSQFLSVHPLLGDTSPETRGALLRKLQIAYSRSGNLIEFSADNVPALMLLRSGSIEIRDCEGALKDRLSAGDVVMPCFLYYEGKQQYEIHTLEDSLYYLMDKTGFEQICEEESILQNLRNMWHRRYRLKKDSNTDVTDTSGTTLPQWRDINSSPLAMSKVVEYTKNRLVNGPPDFPIEQVAMRMREEGVSALVVVENDCAIGIVTDKDLRNRVLADQLSPKEPIRKIMTPDPISVAASMTLHDAQLVMMSHSIQHLVVVEGTKPVGVVTASDIFKASNLEPIPLLSRVNKGKTLESLVATSRYLPQLVAKLIERNTRPSEIGQIITAFTDALTRRLIELSQEKYGEPPCKYTWLAFGSQARQEQMIGSDQDNALILEKRPTPEIEEYFSKFAQWVNDGLHQCGIVYCPGEMMACNPKWRMSLDDWKKRFDKWIDEPEPKALMLSSIFFDMRGVVGNMSLKEELQKHMLTKAQANTIFLAYMAGNSLQHRPPLGFFKNFVVDYSGEHTNELDLKKRGTIPIVDIARNYALANGLFAVNTIDRLRAIREAGIMSLDLANSLVDAHEFIAGLRLKAQAEEHRAREEVDNYLNPKDLSPLQRQQLKEAFQWVKEAQQIMSNRFHANA